jgi:hypothetical protein
MDDRLSTRFDHGEFRLEDSFCEGSERLALGRQRDRVGDRHPDPPVRESPSYPIVPIVARLIRASALICLFRARSSA